MVQLLRTFRSFVAIFANLTQWKLAPFNLNLFPDQLSVFGREFAHPSLLFSLSSPFLSDSFHRSHRRTLSNTSNISRVSFSSDNFYQYGDRSSVSLRVVCVDHCTSPPPAHTHTHAHTYTLTPMSLPFLHEIAVPISLVTPA